MRLNEENVAQLIEVKIGLGIDPAPDCNLCAGRSEACPIHAGKAIARALFAVAEETQ